MRAFVALQVWLLTLPDRTRSDERGISTLVEILAACLLILSVYAVIKSVVENGMTQTIENVFSRFSSA